MICCDRVEVGAIGVVQRLFLANSKAMCPSCANTQDQPHSAHGHEQTKDQEESRDRRPKPFHRQYSCVRGEK